MLSLRLDFKTKAMQQQGSASLSVPTGRDKRPCCIANCFETDCLSELARSSRACPQWFWKFEMFQGYAVFCFALGLLLSNDTFKARSLLQGSRAVILEILAVLGLRSVWVCSKFIAFQ